jgi:hypothetical protein
LRRLIAGIHGFSGAGKSRLLDTIPGPRLILDAEGGTEWSKKPIATWDPARPLPTEDDKGNPITTDTSIVVMVRSFEVLKQVLSWLQSGNHYFESIGWDSLSEIQQRCKRSIRGATSDMTERLWGKLLDEMVDLVSAYRDLRFHPTKPVNVIFLLLTKNDGERKVPDVQGALGGKLPQYLDLLAYLWMEPTEADPLQRMLLIQPFGNIAAKDRTDDLTVRFGYTIPSPNLASMLAVLNEGGA